MNNIKKHNSDQKSKPTIAFTFKDDLECSFPQNFSILRDFCWLIDWLMRSKILTYPFSSLRPLPKAQFIPWCLLYSKVIWLHYGCHAADLKNEVMSLTSQGILEQQGSGSLSIISWWSPNVSYLGWCLLQITIMDPFLGLGLALHLHLIYAHRQVMRQLLEAAGLSVVCMKGKANMTEATRAKPPERASRASTGIERGAQVCVCAVCICGHVCAHTYGTLANLCLQVALLHQYICF